MFQPGRSSSEVIRERVLLVLILVLVSLFLLVLLLLLVLLVLLVLLALDGVRQWSKSYVVLDDAPKLG